MKNFLANYTVTVGDINYGGHMGNDRALVLFQQARILFLESLGYEEKDIGQGAGIIMVESGVRYLREIFLHDRLEIAVTVTECKAKKFSLGYSVKRLPDRELVLTGTTSFLAFTYAARKVGKLPDEFSEALAAYLSV